MKHNRKQFLGKSNRQKLSERMRWTPSCCKFFQMLTRCSYPYITEWIKIQFCILGIKSLADILCIMQSFNIHLEIPWRNESEYCLLQVHTTFSLIYLSLLCLFSRITSWKLGRIFQMCIFISSSILSPLELNSFYVQRPFILEGMGGKKFLSTLSEGELASLVLEVT